jgi:DNA invertase Pin-like site-specific DNA recombinase
MVLAVGIDFGYIRVSTNEQNLDRQLEAIQPYVTNEKYIYSDKASAKDMERDTLNLLTVWDEIKHRLKSI